MGPLCWLDCQVIIWKKFIVFLNVINCTTNVLFSATFLELEPLFLLDMLLICNYSRNIQLRTENLTTLFMPLHLRCPLSEVGLFQQPIVRVLLLTSLALLKWKYEAKTRWIHGKADIRSIGAVVSISRQFNYYCFNSSYILRRKQLQYKSC